MLNVPTLNQADIEKFRESGFLELKGGFAPDQAVTIQNWSTELADWPEEPGKHWVFHETSLKNDGVDLINRIENMTPFHPGFAELAKSLLPSVGQLLGDDAVLFKDKINFKMPGGDGFKPHQDSQAGWEAYAPYFVSVMVCIDAATMENGCLQLAARPKNELAGR